MNKHIIFAFIGGAIAGAGAALLLAPEKGSDLRADIKKLLCKKGLCKCGCGEKDCDCEADAVVDDIIATVQE